MTPVTPPADDATTSSDATAASVDASSDASPAVRRRPRVRLLALTALIALLLDQASKMWALANLTEGVRVPVIGDLLGWRLIFNPGAAFSFGTGVTWVFTIVMGAVGIGVLVFSVRVRSAWWAVALGALLGGALGNLVDRLAREPGFGVGHVVDFIDYGYFIGNVADIAIVGAAIVMVLLSLFGLAWDGSSTRDAARSEADDDGASDGGASDDGGAADGGAAGAV